MEQLNIESPIGILQITLGGTQIVKTDFLQDADNTALGNNAANSKEITNQFAEYFSGTRKDFRLDYNISNGTEFQRKVWQEMLNIPYGQTKTYKQIAEKIGLPKAARAVGMACNKNPLAIIIPCHRIIGSSGKLTGYAGGLAKKQWLLRHENTGR